MRQVDAAREAGDTARVEEIRLQLRALDKKLGKRTINGKMKVTLPKMGWNVGGNLQTFSQWRQSKTSQ